MSERYPREFWHGMSFPAECPRCNYVANGTVYKWLFLTQTDQDFTCYKCGNKWSVVAVRRTILCASRRT